MNAPAIMAFRPEVIRALVKMDLETRSLDLRDWVSIVPRRFRGQILSIVAESEIIGEAMRPDTVERFIQFVVRRVREEGLC